MRCGVVSCRKLRRRASVADGDDILSVEDAWVIHLDERFGEKITEREKREIARYYTRLKLDPPGLEESRELLRRYRQRAGGDIVHCFDDPNDLSWWKSAFKVLKPPDDNTQAD